MNGIIFRVVIDVKKKGGSMEWLDHKSGRVITYLLDKLKEIKSILRKNIFIIFEGFFNFFLFSIKTPFPIDHNNVHI